MLDLSANDLPQQVRREVNVPRGAGNEPPRLRLRGLRIWLDEHALSNCQAELHTPGSKYRKLVNARVSGRLRMPVRMPPRPLRARAAERLHSLEHDREIAERFGITL